MNNVLLKFGIITDTHVRAPGGDQSSPFPVNDKANSRADYASRLLASQHPDFVVHLGDMVHPLPHMEAYDSACTEAKQLFQPLGEAVYFVSGNHDTGDKPMPASPASGIDELAIQKYQEHFGRQFYRVDIGKVVLLVINSSLVNVGTTHESEQRHWLESQLEQIHSRPDSRIFLFSHYPPFVHDSAEPEHYDNYAEPGRGWLLELIEKHPVEAVFSGHVHHYFRNRYADADLYCLPATSFTRQDYAELFRVSPADEFGRDDTGKMHVAMVEVLDVGYRMKLLPTFGRGRGDSLQETTGAKKHNATVQLRHAWYESVDLPYNGPMEEFTRKRARNDYTLMRLLQMGFLNVRVPLSDLADEQLRSAVETYYHSGIRFHAMTLGTPDHNSLNLLSNESRFIESLELVLPVYPESLEVLQSSGSELLVVDDTLTSIPLWLGAAVSSSQPLDTHTGGGGVFAHTVTSGFRVDDCQYVLAALAEFRATNPRSNIAGGVFQTPWEADIVDAFERLGRSCNEYPGTKAQLVIRFSPANPANANFTDEAIAERVLQALRLCDEYPAISIQFDTFADIERGYAPRHGFLDRRFNLRKAGMQLAGFGV